MPSSKKPPPPLSNGNLDETICQQMSSLVELLVTSGKPVLIPEVMKKFKKLCRISDDYVKYAYDLLMMELVRDHSEIRLTAFQMVDELFNRSHAFRDCILEDFQTLMELTLDCEHNCPLPPPKQVASKLKEEAVRCIQQWYDKFGEAYKKLSLGYQYLKTCKKVNFDEVSAQLEVERLQQEETQRKLEEARLMKLEQVKNEMNDVRPDIELCLKEIENCIHLLLPHPDEFFIPDSENPDLTAGLSNEIKKENDTIESVDDRTGLKDGSWASVNKTDMSVDQGTCEKCNSSQAGEDKKIDNIGTVDDRLEDRTKHICSCGKQSNKVKEKSEESITDTKNSVNENKERNSENLELKKSHDSAIANKNSENKNDISKNNVSDKNCEIVKTESGEGSDNDNEEDDIDDDDFEEVGAHAFLRKEYGLGLQNYEISVTVGSDDRLKETEDNKYIIQSLKDQYILVKTKYLGVIKQWIQTMESNTAGTEEIKSANDLKAKLEDALKKCVELEVLGNTDKDDKDSDSDEDFEEVVDKEGYEEDVPEHLQLQALEKPSTSKQTGSKSKSKSSNSKSSKRPSESTSSASKRIKTLASKALASQQKTSFDQVLSEMDCTTSDIKQEPGHKKSDFKSGSVSGEHKTSLKKSASTTNSRSVAKEKKTSLVKSASETSPAKKGSQTPGYWSLNCRLQEEDVKDPTSWKANVTRLREKNEARCSSLDTDIIIKEEPNDTESETSENNVTKDLLEKAPVVSFGKDLEHWENPDKIEAPLQVNYETGRFWISNEMAEKDDKQKVAALTMRTMSYTGDFEPVKWKCRAPLPSGKLCERMDREKCPFHGKIIGRDETGQPTDPADIARLIKSEPKDEMDTEETPVENKCLVCDKIFQSTSALRRHLKRHAEKPYKCDICQKSFSRKDEITRHIIIHDDKKNALFVCDKCGMCYRSKSSLFNHKSSLHENRTFKCEICKNNFVTKQNLIRHKKSHGEKDQCPKCKKFFLRVKDHLPKCENQNRKKQFSCDCGKKFLERKCLVEHKKYKHGPARYRCENCLQLFAHRALLIKHKKKCL